MNYVVTELFIYPIKSLAGITVDSAKAEEMGFENDRRWMLMNQENQFITQRENPILSQFYPEIKGNKIEISFEDSVHEFSISESLEEPLLSKVWDDETVVQEVNKGTSKWFSEALGFRCKLVKIVNKGDRKHKSEKLHKTLNVSLADGFPYLLIGSESLNFLNEKLDEKTTINRFRPNIVISSTIAHEEDSFDTFQIGNVHFINAKPCGRCVMVNNNPETGVVMKEPLKTLSTYRVVDNTVFFGTNIMCINEGPIAVGDALHF
ncbi:MOSC domain-containing protein [Flavobacterium cellulosilyticum]|uniref:MOSC domain-containing protein n=1 Tax=Flavobacterium cellulosilyticum TaxID=2541731 RepID=A0A4R5CCR5_9FLAO|nr:MOSC N-terminal beta barrel domain-containing protein [Flavobacterium cellulosilyticum]TDD96616.1 MOSC domain-containing protein [Flavobacterium cellulosilyticum]